MIPARSNPWTGHRLFGVRLMAALINAGAALLWTHYLVPGELGAFAIIVAFAGMTSMIGYDWFRQSMFRLESADADPRAYAVLVLMAYGITSILAVAFWGSVALLGLGLAAPAIALMVPLVAGSQALFDLASDRLARQLAAGRYAVMVMSRALLFLVGGWLVSVYRPIAPALAVALLLANLLPSIAVGLRGWTLRTWVPEDSLRLKSYAAYGAPLAAAMLLAFLSGALPRLFLARGGQVALVGRFTASADPLSQAGTLLASALLLVNYPSVLADIDRSEHDSANARLWKHARTLLGAGGIGVAMAVTVGQSAIRAVIGPEYRDAVAHVVPFVAPGIMLLALRAYCFELAFQIAKQSLVQLAAGAVVAGCGVVAYLVLIPRYGIDGAGLGLLLVAALGAIVSVSIAAHRRLGPPMWQTLGRGLAIACAAALVGRYIAAGAVSPERTIACMLALLALNLALTFVGFPVRDRAATVMARDTSPQTT